MTRAIKHLSDTELNQLESNLKEYIGVTKGVVSTSRKAILMQLEAAIHTEKTLRNLRNLRNLS